MKLRGVCPRHGGEHPCTCAMGNLYRFVEPAVLLLLKEKGEAHGYSLAGEMETCSLTDANVEPGALYRTLRALECNGYVVSRWDAEHTGPARRVYRLTTDGEAHLDEWATVLAHLSESMGQFVERVRGPQKSKADLPPKGRQIRTKTEEGKRRPAKRVSS